MRSLLLAAAALLAMRTGAQAAVALDLTITVNGITQSFSGTDSIDVPSVTINGVAVTFEQALATSSGLNNTLFSSAATVSNTTGSSVSISAVLTATGFVGPDNRVQVSGSGTWEASRGSVMNQFWYDDPTNSGNHTPAELVDSFTYPPAGSGTSSFSFTSPVITLAHGDPGLFSMTEAWNYTLAGHGLLTSRGQNEVKTFVPEPASLTLFGFGLIGLGTLMRTRKR